MRRPRAGNDNGNDRYGVRVDEPRRHLSSPLFSSSPSLLPSSSLLPCLLLLPSPSSPPPPPFSFFFFLLPFFSFLLSFLLFLLPPPPSYSGRAGAAGAWAGEPAGRARGEPAAAARRRGGYGARVCACLVCACVRFFLYFKPVCRVPDPGHSAQKVFC